MVAELIHNAALLVALSALYGLWARWRAGAVPDKVLAGLMFGALAIAAMNMPFTYSPGVIYDGRSVVLTLAGLFGGTFAAVVAVVLAGAYRAYLGGPGVWAGMATILSCALVGLTVHHLCVRRGRPELVSPLELYGVGLATHGVMLLCQLLLPWPGALETIGRIWLPVMLVFPLATLLAGVLLGDENRRIVAAATLRDSEEHLRTVLDSIGDAVIATDMRGRVTAANPVALRLTGWEAKEALGQPLEQVFHIISEMTRNVVEGPVTNVMRQGTIVGLANHTLLISKTGTETPIADSGAPIRNEAGEMTGVVLVFRDRTEERDFERRLSESEARYRTAFETSPDSININRADGLYVDINDGFTQLTGYTRADVIGRSSIDLGLWVVPKDRETLLHGLQTSGAVENLEAKFRCKDGAIKTGLMSARLVSIQGENHILSITRDITERLRLESRLRHSQKIETIGRLAGGIAHDFNNSLMVILGYVELMLEDQGLVRSHRDPLLEVQRAGVRARDITRQLLAFSRQQPVKPMVRNLNDSAAILRKVLGRLVGENIEIVTSFAAELGDVRIDPGQLEQVLMNLVVNARDAMPQGGTLTIATANVALDEAFVRQHVGVAIGPYVMLAVTDTGCGMDAETMARIFDPFFTTKELGKGTGLGLATVYGIVSQAGGHIECRSEPGHGATFTIYLPRTEASPVRASDRQHEEPRHGGGDHILVVEDEAAVRELIRRMLESLEYRVTLAANGNEALALMTEQGLEPDLIVTDAIMPGMGGAELIERVRKLRPDQKFLCMSGYPDDAIGHHQALSPDTPFLQKPFTGIGELAAKIELALHPQTGTASS